MNILGGSGPWYYLYPATGGYGESTGFPMRCTGFSNPYTAEVRGRTLTLTGKGSDGLVFRRTVVLPERGSTIEISSSITNGTDTPVVARLRCVMELDSDPDGTMVDTGTGEEKAADFTRNGARKPAGVWSVRSASGGWRMENRFPADSVESCRLTSNMGYLYSIRDLKAKSVAMEVLFEQDSPPEASPEADMGDREVAELRPGSARIRSHVRPARPASLLKARPRDRFQRPGLC